MVGNFGFVDQPDGPELFYKTVLQRKIDLGHRHGQAKVDQRRNAKARLPDPTWHNPAKMTEVGFDIQGDPMETDPFSQTDTDRGDFVFAQGATRFGAIHPDSNAPDAAFPPDIKGVQGIGYPGFQRRDESSDVPSAPIEVQHHITNPLSGSVIGILPTPRTAINRELRIQQIGFPCTRTRCVEGWMFQKPDELRL